MKVREFAHPNTSGGWLCKLCKTAKDSPVVLVGIPGTEDGGNMEAEQIHTKCFRVWAEMNEIEVDIDPAII